MFSRPLYRLFFLVAAAFVAIWVFFYPLYAPLPSIPFHGLYQSESDKQPQKYSPPRPYPPPPRPHIDNSQWETRAQKVRDAFVYAWNGYQKHAAGWDELTPVDGGKVNK